MCVLLGHPISWWRNGCWYPCACKYLGITAQVHWQSYKSKRPNIWRSWWVGNILVCCLFLHWWWRQWSRLSQCQAHMSGQQVPEWPVHSHDEVFGVWWQRSNLAWGCLESQYWWDVILLGYSVELEFAGIWQSVVHHHHRGWWWGSWYVLLAQGKVGCCHHPQWWHFQSVVRWRLLLRARWSECG